MNLALAACHNPHHYHSILLITTTNAITTTITTATVMTTSVEPAGPRWSTHPAHLLLVAVHCHLITSPHPPLSWWLHCHIPPIFFFFSRGILNVSFIVVRGQIASIPTILLISFSDRNFSDNQAGGQRVSFWLFCFSSNHKNITLAGFKLSLFPHLFSWSRTPVATSRLHQPSVLAHPLPSSAPFSPGVGSINVSGGLLFVFCSVVGVMNLTITCLQCFGQQLLPPTATAMHHHLCQQTLASNK